MLCALSIGVALADFVLSCSLGPRAWFFLSLKLDSDEMLLKLAVSSITSRSLLTLPACGVPLVSLMMRFVLLFMCLCVPVL